jgi:hypothetical protein
VISLLKNPYVYFPQPNLYINYPDAVHYLRGQQNFELRDFEVEINIPSVYVNGEIVPDYDLIQRIWWTGLEIVEENQDVINVSLEMRIFKGSEATLAPEFGYDFVCSIDILRTKPLNSSAEKIWKKAIAKIFNAWKVLTDCEGNRGNYPSI